MGNLTSKAWAFVLCLRWGGENLTGSVRFEFFCYIYIYIYIAVVIKWLTKRGLQKLGSIFEAFYEK